MTQKTKVIARLDAVGYVDNFWAIQNYILRLGAVVFDLTGVGWKFKKNFGSGGERKNYFYYPVVDPRRSSPRAASPITADEFIKKFPSKVVDNVPVQAQKAMF